jgi:hypothetical protein
MCKEDDSSLHIFIGLSTEIVGKFFKNSNKNVENELFVRAISDRITMYLPKLQKVR